jgi:hypothetical protein
MLERDRRLGPSAFLQPAAREVQDGQTVRGGMFGFRVWSDLQ